MRAEYGRIIGQRSDFKLRPQTDLEFVYSPAAEDGTMTAGEHVIRFRFTVGEGRKRKDVEIKVVVIVSPNGMSRLIDLRNAPNDHRQADPKRLSRFLSEWERVY